MNSKKITENKNGKYFYFGDSHVYDFLIHIKDEKICNCSYPSDNAKDILNKVRAMLDRGIIDAEDTLFIQVDESNFSTYKERNNNLDLSSDLNSSLLFYRHYVPLLSNDKLISYETLIEVYKILVNYQHPFYEPNPEKIKVRIKSQFGDFQVNNNMILAYQELFKELKERNITVFLIKFPVINEYYENIKPEFRAEINEFINSLEMIHLDFSGELDDIKYFKNQDHLNKQGAMQLYNSIEYKIQEISNEPHSL